MRKLFAALLALSSLPLAACSTLSVESDARDLQAASAFTRTLVVVVLPDTQRRVAEDALVAQLASLHPSTSYPTVALAGGVTLGDLRDQARRDRFDSLLVVWFDGMTQKYYPECYPELYSSSQFDTPPSTAFGLRFVASLTALDGDHEIWKGIATQWNPYPNVRRVPELMAAIANRLKKDGARTER